MQFDEQDLWRYVSGKMSQEERVQYNSFLENNPELQLQLQDEASYIRFLEQKDAKEKAFKNLAEVHQQYTAESNLKVESNLRNNPPPIKKTSPTIIRWIGTIALAASLILGIMYINGLNNTSSDPGILYAQAFNPSEISLDVRGSNNDISGIDEVVELFNAKNYKGAIDLLESIGIPSEHEEQVLYLKGISLLSTDQTSNARTTLNDLINKNSNFKDDASWYIALSHLKDGNIAECRTVLQNLPADYIYADQIKKILKATK